jgi:hypothetical protein
MPYQIVPPGVCWDIKVLFSLFKTGATAGNRYVWLTIKDSSDKVLGRYSHPATLTANNTWNLSWGGIELINTTNYYHSRPMGSFLLYPSDKFRLDFSFLDPSDRLEDVLYRINEYKLP